MSKPAARCPRCGSRELQLIEYSRAFTTFEQNADGNIDPEGWHNHGDIYEVHGKCPKCGHRWRLRGITQITDLAGYDEDSEGVHTR